MTSIQKKRSVSLSKLARRKSSTKIHLDLDEVLDEVGHFGLYQFRLFGLLVLPVMFAAGVHAQYVFNAGDIKYRCLVPECEKPPGAWKPGIWGEWALVSGSTCKRRKPIIGNNTFCERTTFTKSTMRCNAWVYETKETIVAEFNLACKDWQRTLVGTIHSIGVFSALTFIGIVSDTIGRRTTFIMASVCGATMGMIRSFATSYIFYVIFEYLDAVLSAAIYSTGFIIVGEMVGKQKRVLCGSLLACFFSLGLVYLASVAWLFPYWRTLTRVLYAPGFFVLSYFCCLAESIRWLMTKNKIDTAVTVLKRVASMNGKHLSAATINNLTNYVRQQQQASAEDKKPPVWRQVLRSKILMCRVLVCSTCWMTVTFIYYGLSINSVTLMGNKYINYMLTALVEIPGYAVSNVLLDRFGRKRSIMAALLCCGCTLFSIPIIPEAYGLFPTLLAKGFISLAFVSVYIFTVELFPTSARHSLMAACSLIGRFGSIAAPQTPLLLKVKKWLPYVLFGCVSFLAALLLTLTPETLRKPMPETVSQAELLHRTPEILPEPSVDLSQLAGKSSPRNLSRSSSKASEAMSKGDVFRDNNVVRDGDVVREGDVIRDIDVVRDIDIVRDNSANKK